MWIEKWRGRIRQGWGELEIFKRLHRNQLIYSFGVSFGSVWKLVLGVNTGRACFFSPWRGFITFALEVLYGWERNTFLKLEGFVLNWSLGLHTVKLINAPKTMFIKCHLYGHVLHPPKGNQRIFWYTMQKLWVAAEHSNNINTWPKKARLATHEHIYWPLSAM